MRVKHLPIWKLVSAFIVSLCLYTTASAQIPSFAQIAADKTGGSPASTLSVTFSQNTVAGDLILVGLDNDTHTTPTAVTDTQNNVFTEVGSQLTSAGGRRSRVYYAKNIKGGADTVTVTLTANSGWIEMYLSEYSGVDQTNPIDAQAGAAGGVGAVSSGNATTTVSGDVIFGFCIGDWACTGGSGFTSRSTFNANLVENEVGGNPGSYAATRTSTNGWTMQMVALKPAAVMAPALPATRLPPKGFTNSSACSPDMSSSCKQTHQ